MAGMTMTFGDVMDRFSRAGTVMEIDGKITMPIFNDMMRMVSMMRDRVMNNNFDDFTLITRMTGTMTNYSDFHKTVIYATKQNLVDIFKNGTMTDENGVQILMSMVILCDRIITMSITEFRQNMIAILLEMIQITDNWRSLTTIQTADGLILNNGGVILTNTIIMLSVAVMSFMLYLINGVNSDDTTILLMKDYVILLQKTGEIMNRSTNLLDGVDLPTVYDSEVPMTRNSPVLVC